jgi:uncharacterized protein (DUF433 family)
VLAIECDIVELPKEVRDMWYERISIDPKVCHGQACIKGTRIPVHQIVRMLANGDTIEELLEEYPSLERDDILACLDYAASLAEEQITPIEALASAI